MKIGGKKTHMISLESVAMTDIIMNMFIFFFISFSLLYTFSPQRAQKLEVKLPKANNSSNFDTSNQVVITLTNEGLIYLGDEAVTFKGLKDRMKAKYVNNNSVAIVLRADKLVSFKNIVNVLDILTELGLTNLNIATSKE